MFLLCEQDDAALIVATGTVSDFAARIGLALLSAFFALEPRYIYLAGAMGFLITRFGMHFGTYRTIQSYLELFGKYNFISCVYSIFVHIQFQWNDGDCSFSWDISHINTCAGQFDLCRAFATGEVNQKQSLVFFATDIFINQSNNFEFLVCRFAAGYGLFMFFQGNLMFLLGPIVGWIRDITQSYILLVYCLQFFMSLCVFPWLIEIVWLRVKARKSNG